jgi:hypothetical protein
MKNILEFPVPKTLETPKCFLKAYLSGLSKKTIFIMRIAAQI